MPKGGRRPNSGRPKGSFKPDDPTDPYVREQSTIYPDRAFRAFFNLWPGDSLTERLEAALLDLARHKPLGPGSTPPRGEGGRWLRLSDPLAPVREAIRAGRSVSRLEG